MSRFKSIQERKLSIFEDGCASCGGGMTAGDGGFSGDSPSEGPVAGYDPLMSKLDKVRKKRKKKVA